MDFSTIKCNAVECLGKIQWGIQSDKSNKPHKENFLRISTLQNAYEYPLNLNQRGLTQAEVQTLDAQKNMQETTLRELTAHPWRFGNTSQQAASDR